MSETPTERRLAAHQTETRRDTIAEGLAQPARVTHPTMADELTVFDVMIEMVFLRQEEGEQPRLAFRGAARSGDWSGFKTFFADACEEVIDGTNNSRVTDLDTWLRSLRPQSAPPLTLRSVIDAVSAYLTKAFVTTFAAAGAVVGKNGLIIEFKEPSSATGPDDAPILETAFVVISGPTPTDYDAPFLGPIKAVIFENDPRIDPEPHVEMRDGVTIETTDLRIPLGSVTFLSRASGRVDVIPL